jgi:hypothetical protein
VSPPLDEPPGLSLEPLLDEHAATETATTTATGATTATARSVEAKTRNVRGMCPGSRGRDEPRLS